jgi:hypothetical protein
MGGLYYLLIQAPAHNFGASFGMLLLLFVVSLLYIWVEVTYFHSKTELNGVEYHMPITGKTGDVTTPTSAAPKKEEEVCI